MILKKVCFQSINLSIGFLKQAKKKCLITVPYTRKSVSNFNFLSVFVGKIKLNFYYKKITDKMYDNMKGKYKNNVFQILKICKVFNSFDFSSTIR